MKTKYTKKIIVAIFILLTLVITTTAFAQTYAFSLPQETVDLYWENDGALSLRYEFIFTNANYADPIDYIDVGMPTKSYNLSNASAEVNGQQITHIADSAYVDGIELGLGANAIQPGDTGEVIFQITGIQNVLYTDKGEDEYASAVFSPTWFDSSLVSGTTNLTVTYHLPSDVSADAPRWHQAPSGFPEEPVTGFDENGRITYTWNNPSADPSEQYLFGASFPMAVIPAAAVATPTFWQNVGVNPEDVFGFLCMCGIFSMFIIIPVLSIRSAQKRKLQYLPPKLSVEGHGIKRGLTAIEAAILLEQPMDKILTMLLFAVVKKGAVKVVKRDPIAIEVTNPLPEGLRDYEIDFINGMKESNKSKRTKELQDAMISLIKSVTKSMKGFSTRETKNYYEKIIEAAWQQVEAADTPEVKSEKYNQVMEWTMLDKEYDERTRRTFRTYPVFLPTWWHNYNPRPFAGGGAGRASAPTKTSAPASRPTPGGTQMPSLPGADFAASVVNGVENFSAGVVGSIAGFTGAVTNKTNPVPKTTSHSSGRSSRGGGGSSCACACACAGCACACAGGGR